MTLMGILIFTGMNAVGQGMEQSSIQFYVNTNLADAFLYGNEFTKEECELLEKEANIDLVERRMQMNVMVENNNKATIQLNIVEENQISVNHLVEGIHFDATLEGIWLDYAYAKANSLKVGDEIKLLFDTNTQLIIIKGLIMNPEYVYALKDDNEVIPDHKNYGYAFLSSNYLSKFNDLKFNQLLIKSKSDKKTLDPIILNVFQEKYAVLVMQKDHPSVKMFQNEMKQMKAVETVFPIAFLLIAVLTSLTTMTRITVNQRTQIGTLKALGFSNRKIITHYVSYGASIGLISGLLGLILGPVLLPNIMFRFQKEFYTLPEWKGMIEPVALMVVVLTVISCSLCGYFACKREVVGAAAQILRPKPPKVSKHTKIEKSRFWMKMKFDVQWNIRDVIRNKLRAFITIFGIIGCMTLIICAFGLRDTILEMKEITYEERNTYDNKVYLSKTMTLEQLDQLKKNEEYQLVQETAIELSASDIIESTFMTVVGEGDYLNYKDIKGNTIRLPKAGVAITNKVAKLYQLDKGDQLKWRIYGTKNWVLSDIKEIIHNPIGQGVYVSEEAYMQLNLTMSPTTFLTNASTDSLESGEFDTVQSKEDLITTMNNMMETMNAMIVILVFAAVLLGVVVLYNLGVLSFHERLRELTTLKVLGFQYEKLCKLIHMQNIWLTLIGTLFGIPSGFLLLSYMMKFMGDSLDMLPYISVQSYVISVAGTIMISILVNLILSRKLKKIDMVSALKAVE
jgi:putative ABC transport system permease protein